MRISLFVTCFNDTLFPQTGRAVVRLLERLGCEVDFPLEQTCCGQMHMNSGYAREGAALARRFARVFGDAEMVVTPSASCAGMLRHQLADEDAPPVYELSELIVDRLGIEDVGAHFPHRVTFHPTCHSLRELGVGDRPLRLLRAVSGIELVELPQSDECCGFGGTFAVKNAEVSSAMLADKVRAVLDTGAEIVCAGDNSCLMHIDGALSRQRTGVRCMHLAEILASRQRIPKGGRRHSARLAAAPQPGQGNRHDPRQARGGGGGGARLERAAAGRASGQGRRAGLARRPARPLGGGRGGRRREGALGARRR